MATIILTGGGTAGHCTPNLALIPYLRKIFDNIYYVGSNNGIEKQLVKNSKITYFSVDCAKLNRNISLNNFKIPFKLLKGYMQSKALISKLKPDVIFSKGGYVSLPLVIAGHKKKVPVISHESDLTMGLANKLASKYCDKILTSFPETANEVSNGVYTGCPLREQLFLPLNKKELYYKFGFSGKKPIITVTGGSQGARAINTCLLSCLDEILPHFDVIHICGKNNKNKVKKEGYYCCEYLDNIEQALKISSVVISRAGANTLFELLSLNVPTIAIPLPKGNSRGDQVLNAQYFYKKGLIYLLSQNTLTPKSLEFAIKSTYANRFNMIKELQKYSLTNGCDKIIDVIKQYLP